MVKKTNTFLSYTEASAIVSKMGISSYKDYLAIYKKYPGLPSNPDKTYKDEYEGWVHYKGGLRIYLTFDEARDAVIKLGIKTWSEYKKRHKEDPQLPCSPVHKYGESYRGFAEFSGQTKPGRYATMTEASEAAVRLGIKGVTDYRARYYQDPLLHSRPASYYSDEWKGWAFF